MATEDAATETSMIGWTMPVTGQQLERLTVNERALLLGMWHATNELNALQKMILLASNLAVSGAVEEAARSLNSWMLIKVFATKVFEAWDFFRSAQNFPEFRQVYLIDPDATGLAKAKEWLGKYFGRRNLMETVRNKAGAHYDYSFVLAASGEVSQLNSFVLLSEHQGNSLYWAAEEVIAQGFKSATSSDDLRSLVDQITGEVIDVATKLDDLAQYIGIVAFKRANNRGPKEQFATVRLSARKGERCDIPYFIDFSQPMTEATSASVDRSTSSGRPG
jgi:hypothetical protein